MPPRRGPAGLRLRLGAACLMLGDSAGHAGPLLSAPAAAHFTITARQKSAAKRRLVMAEKRS